MSAAKTGHAVLSKDLMELQLGQIDLLMAMYESDNSITMDASSSDLVRALREWCEGEREAVPEFSESAIPMLLTLELDDEDGDEPGEKKCIQLHLSVRLLHERGDVADSATEPPPVKARIQQPEWMSKGKVAQLNGEIPDEDILTVIEHIKEVAVRHLTESRKVAATPGILSTDAGLVRVWFYFPSISTRAKRDDLVNYAPTYGLTGFLLAGKPGILCLEGGSSAIDDFMKFIKTESWGDIPSQHKKVSERFRETGSDTKRAFKDMREITDLVGERRGERANRNDMKALEAWLAESGLGEAFGKVLM